MKLPNRPSHLLALLLTTIPLLAQNAPPIAGVYEGTVTVRGQQVPARLRITGSGTALQAALLNGPEQAPASAVTLSGNHLLLTFNYFARTLDATVAGREITGTFGTTTTRYPIALHPAGAIPAATSDVPTPDLSGAWEIAVQSAKGESAWTLEAQTDPATRTARAIIQRIDGDTGSLYGQWTGSEYRVSHLTAAGPALYSLTPQSDGTLLVSNLLSTEDQKAQQQNLVARRPTEARKLNLSPPTLPTQQTSIKDPRPPSPSASLTSSASSSQTPIHASTARSSSSPSAAPGAPTAMTRRPSSKASISSSAAAASRSSISPLKRAIS